MVEINVTCVWQYGYGTIIQEWSNRASGCKCTWALKLHHKAQQSRIVCKRLQNETEHHYPDYTGEKERLRISDGLAENALTQRYSNKNRALRLSLQHPVCWVNVSRWPDLLSKAHSPSRAIKLTTSSLTSTQIAPGWRNRTHCRMGRQFGIQNEQSHTGWEEQRDS